MVLVTTPSSQRALSMPLFEVKKLISQGKLRTSTERGKHTIAVATEGHEKEIDEMLRKRARKRLGHKDLTV